MGDTLGFFWMPEEEVGEEEEKEKEEKMEGQKTKKALTCQPKLWTKQGFFGFLPVYFLYGVGPCAW